MGRLNIADPPNTDNLPAGLRHPFDTSLPRLSCYRHGHTFTWLEGDKWVSVQPGRVANADRVRLIHDTHPDQPPTLGRVPIVGAMPAPPADDWYRPGTLHKAADTWAARKAARR